MFKCTFVVLALAVSAALAVNTPDFQQQRQPAADASHLVSHWKQRPEKFVPVSEPSKEDGGLIKSGLSGLLTLVGLPKKALCTVVGFVTSVVAMSVAGLVSAVSGICATAFYFFGGGLGVNSGVNGVYGGGHGDAEGQASELKLESISDFVTSAFNKFESLEKA